MATTKKTNTKTATAKASAKVEEAKAQIETTKDSTKALETKAGVLKEEPIKAEPAKTEAALAAKAAPKKAAASKKESAEPAKKAEIKTSICLQFEGKEVTEKEVLKKIKEVWTKMYKNKIGDIKTVDIYLKPEEAKAYFVVNSETTGEVDL